MCTVARVIPGERTLGHRAGALTDVADGPSGPASDSFALAVDIGTASVAAAVARDGKPEMVALGDRSVTSPADVVRAEDGALLVGEAAAARAVADPDRHARGLKRCLGETPPIMLGGMSHSPTTLLAALLDDVLASVLDTQGRRPHRLVLTHPAGWDPFRRGLFEVVPTLLGWDEVTLVPDPVAAAAHHLSSHRPGDGETFAVYDLGDGTMDAAVFRVRDGAAESLGTPMGFDLGGTDFDAAIVALVNRAVGGALDELETRDPRTRVLLARLRLDCRRAREALTADSETVVPVFLPRGHIDVEITRAEFEDAIREPVESTVRLLRAALDSAGVEPAGLTTVLLVGGASRTPLVAETLCAALGRPVTVDPDPERTVALGAATLAPWPDGPVRAEARRDPPPSGLGSSLPGVPEPPSREPWDSDEHPPREPRDSSGPPPRDPWETGGSPRRARARRGRRLLVIAAGVAVLAVATGAVWIGSGSTAPPAPATPPPTPAVLLPGPTGVAASVPVARAGAPIPVGRTPVFAAVSPNGRVAYVADRDARAIVVVDTATRRAGATIPIPAGPPRYVTVAPDGRRAYVSVFDDARSVAVVVVVDTVTNAVTATVPVRSRPFAAAVAPDGLSVWVPDHDSRAVSVVDTRTGVLVRDIPVESSPHWVAFSRDGTRAYISLEESGLVVELDTANDREISRVRVAGAPYGLAVHPDRQLALAGSYASSSVTMIDTLANTSRNTIPVGNVPQGVAWAADGRHAYVVGSEDDTVSVIDTAAAVVTATVPTPPGPTSISVSPDGRVAYVPCTDGAVLAVLDLAG